MTAQVAADLRAAAEVLRRDGWTRKRLYNRDGQHCAVGALVVAVRPTARQINHLPPADKQRLDAAAAKVVTPRLFGPPYARLMGWNDAPGRTADEVIAALEAAADAAEADQ